MASADVLNDRFERARLEEPAEAGHQAPDGSPPGPVDRQALEGALGSRHRPGHPPGHQAAGVENWAQLTNHLYQFIVRPIAVGGMLVGASFTLFRMRKNLALGIKRGVADIKKSAAAHEATARTERGDAMFLAMARGACAQVIDIDSFGALLGSTG